MSPISVQFTQEEVDLILRLHNELRDRTAAGTVVGFENVLLPPASKMATTRWDDTLAFFGDLNTRLCFLKHQCSTTSVYTYAGQNLFRLTSNAPEFNVSEVIEWAMRDFAKEALSTRPSDIRELSGISQGNFHFLC